MKTNRFFCAALMTAVALCAATTVNAKSWRINHNPQMKAHFLSINEAMASDEVQAGDVLYLDPNTTLSNTQDVTKQVTIIGTGWGGGEVNYARAVISGALNIRAAETKIVGLYMTGNIYIYADYVTMERCRIMNAISTSGYNCKFATIRNCYISTNGGHAIQGQGKTSANSAYWTIENSIICSSLGWSAVCISNLYSATIKNNLLIAHYQYSSSNTIQELGNATIQNNIIIQKLVEANRSGTIWDCDGTFLNNVISQDFEASSNYVIGNDPAEVLTGDYESYTLVEGSPAINGGTDGTDVGIFGGLYPYVATNGLPKGYPYYTRNIVGAKAVDGKVNVSLNVKIENE